ncbi:hypothetical protein [Proteus mirabilis]|uniref:hypothetical protein n=1 Tax=Proteus mirabilis TaxID=584 RepID=UPI0013D21E91|nr:hypothetical protein [Proteus mirabilis]ELA7711700.1 hypothetical protein [Proteus mirabilis]ELA7863469.1 hypothetical protein [Proteus mirabilis]ELB1215934.1 hypothetical protein [Proteus mirabilis]ELB1713114.1 hypothetical protein [Proteus mirabilis]MBG2964245.1 hypothetical protein [Proteus mirabilis]
MAKVECKVCEYVYDDSEIDYCPRCDETTPPKGIQCEFCDNLATSYVQDHPVCDDCYDDAYPVD